MRCNCLRSAPSIHAQCLQTSLSGHTSQHVYVEKVSALIAQRNVQRIAQQCLRRSAGVFTQTRIMTSCRSLTACPLYTGPGTVRSLRWSPSAGLHGVTPFWNHPSVRRSLQQEAVVLGARRSSAKGASAARRKPQIRNIIMLIRIHDRLP